MNEYLEDMLVRMAYHSSGIEGNTISLPQTVSIILEGTLPGENKSIREFYEIENHKQTFDYMLDQLDSKQPLSLDIILNIHALLTDRLQHDRGKFKSNQNAIRGAEFQTATPQETPMLMRQWIDNLNYRLDQDNTVDEFYGILADTHIQLERIHPFSDGNGRTGRMIMMYLSLKYQKVPVIISKDNRAKYIELLAEQNAEGLKDILKSSYEFEKERMKQFG